MKSYKTIDQYIAACAKEVQPTLKTIHQTIKQAAPKAEEKISYGMPSYHLNGILVYFGAFKNHISFFPTSTPIPKFKKELSKYKVSKGTIQFALDAKIPYTLIKKITRFKVKENRNKK